MMTLGLHASRCIPISLRCFSARRIRFMYTWCNVTYCLYTFKGRYTLADCSAPHLTIGVWNR
jgi:hypothetical protein